MRSEPQSLSVRVPRGIRVPTSDRSYRCQSPAGEHLIMDPAAKLVRGCTVAVLFGCKFVLVGRLARRPVQSRHLVIECRDVCGNKCITRVWGLKEQGRPDLARHGCPLACRL